MTQRPGRRRLAGVLAMLALVGTGTTEAATVSGRVVSFPDGDGLAGVQVLARDPQGASAAGVTEADGTFAIDGVDPGSVRVQARPPDTMNRLGAYAGDVSGFCAAQVFALDDAVGDVRIELPVGGSIAGALLDAHGLPSPGLVIAQGADTLNAGLRRGDEVAADGEVEVVGLASWIDGAGDVLPGAYRVSASLPGEPVFYAPGVWALADAELVPAVRGEVTTVSLRRPDGATITGVAQTPTGEPLPGAQIAVLAAGFGVVWTGSSGPDGSWEASDVPGDALQVRVRAMGRTETWAGGTWGASGAASLPGGEVADVGVVMLDGARAVRLELSGDAATLSVVGTITVSDDAPLRTESVTFVDGEAEISGLPPTDLSAVLRLPGWLDTAVSLPATDGDAVASPRAAMSAAAVVWDRTSSRPLRGSTLDAIDPTSGAMLGSTRTDGEGRAVLDALPAQDVLLRAGWRPFCPGERSRVDVWSGGVRSERFAERVPTGAPAEVRFALPPDGDADGMDDVWELLHDLDLHRNDGVEDPDGDGVSSRDEYLAYTDPLLGGPSTFGCSVDGTDPTCGASASSMLLMLLLLAGGVVRRGPDR